MAAFFVAFRCLLGRAREGGRYLRGAAAGIALSLVPIMVTLMVADGMIRGITDRYLELGTGHIRAWQYDRGEFPPPESFRDLPGIRGVFRERQGLGIVMGSGGKAGTAIRALDPSFLADAGSRRFLRVLEGQGTIETPGQVLLGGDLAQSVGARVGKSVYIMSIRRGPEGRNLPRTLPFTVAGIVSSGYRELDSLWCIMSWEGGQRLLAPDYSDDWLLVKIENPYTEAERIAAGLRDLLPAYGVYTWGELESSQYRSYESTRQILLFIMAMIVAVAAVNVSSATAMLVIERRQDIAVLKAAGASPAFAARVFLLASFLTGLLGALGGISLGLLIGFFINPLIHSVEALLSFVSGLFRGGEVKILDPGYYLEEIPVIIDWRTVCAIGVFTVLLSMLASWIPARQAGRLRPMEIFRRF